MFWVGYLLDDWFGGYWDRDFYLVIGFWFEGFLSGVKVKFLSVGSFFVYYIRFTDRVIFI